MCKHIKESYQVLQVATYQTFEELKNAAENLVTIF